MAAICARRIIRLAILRPLPILRLRLMLIRLSRLPLILRLLLLVVMMMAMIPRWAVKSLTLPILHPLPILHRKRPPFPKPTN